ncbi:MAG: hypothetical protein ABI082_01765 [Dokdonella sp.]
MNVFRGSASRLVLIVLATLWLLGSLRAFALWTHDPLYAYANSYDQTRYTNCFHFYPDRAASIPPQQNSPQAPFANYRFMTASDPMCYWSSELVFTGATALTWKLGEAINGDTVHNARWIGAWRWLALLALSIAFSSAWLRRGDARAAIANAALLPLLFADPGNTLYLNSFYAEWTALIATYALIASVLLWRGQIWSRHRGMLIALAAFALATAKIQHLLLPLGLAVIVMILDHTRTGRVGWRAFALALGALAGFSLQFVQLHRSGPMIDAIDQYNRADVVFTALVPFADDRDALLQELGIDPACAIYSDHHAWEFPDLPERICSGLEHFNRAAELRTLLRHPRIAWRLAKHGVLALDPWIAKNLGEVEGGDFATMPTSQPSLGRTLHAAAWLQWSLLALPFLGLFALLVRPGLRRGNRALDYTTMTTMVMLGTFAITVLGDGLADTAKQGHLVINAALAWLIVMVVCAVTRPRAMRNTSSTR